MLSDNESQLLPRKDGNNFWIEQNNEHEKRKKRTIFLQNDPLLDTSRTPFRRHRTKKKSKKNVPQRLQMKRMKQKNGSFGVKNGSFETIITNNLLLLRVIYLR